MLTLFGVATDDYRFLPFHPLSVPTYLFWFDDECSTGTIHGRWKRSQKASVCGRQVDKRQPERRVRNKVSILKKKRKEKTGLNTKDQWGILEVQSNPIKLSARTFICYYETISATLQVLHCSVSRGDVCTTKYSNGVEQINKNYFGEVYKL